MELLAENLAHYGVKGMKWGVRKDRKNAKTYKKENKAGVKSSLSSTEFKKQFLKEQYGGKLPTEKQQKQFERKMLDAAQKAHRMAHHEQKKYPGGSTERTFQMPTRNGKKIEPQTGREALNEIVMMYGGTSKAHIRAGEREYLGQFDPIKGRVKTPKLDFPWDRKGNIKPYVPSVKEDLAVEATYLGESFVLDMLFNS